MRLWVLFLASPLLLSFASGASADWPPGGRRLSAIPAPGYSSAARGVLADGAGGATLTWSEALWHPLDLYDSYTDYAQHLGASGEVVAGWPAPGIDLGSWNPFTGPVWSKRALRLLPDAAGGAYLPTVTWLFAAEDIALLQLTRIRANGTSQSLGFAWPGGLTQATAAAADADASGGIVFVASQWTYASPGNPLPPRHLFVQRADATGALLWPPEPECPGPSVVPPGQQLSEWGLAAASDGAGGLFVAWVDGRDATSGPGGTPDPDLYVQRFLADGSVAPGWPTGGVGVCTAVGLQYSPSLVHAGGGVVFVGWLDQRVAPVQVYVACLDGSGAPAVGCPLDGRPLGDPGAQGGLLELLADGAGGALVLRREASNPPPSSVIYAQRIKPDGLSSPGWPPAGRALGAVGSYTAGGAMCGDGGGGLFALYSEAPAYSSPAGIYAMHIAASGTDAPGWGAGAAQLSATGTLPVAIDGSSGSAIAMWTDTRHPEGRTVYAHRLQSDGPVAIAISLEGAIARPGGAVLRWHVAYGADLRATISRRTASTDWVAIGAAIPDGTGRIEFEDRLVTAGMRYGYRLEFDDLGAPQVAGEVWLEIPSGLSFALEPPRPNPIEGALRMVVELDRDGPARIELVDVSGRRMLARDVPVVGPGSYVVEIAEAGRLPAGLYFARLTQHDQERSRRVIVVR